VSVTGTGSSEVGTRVRAASPFGERSHVWVGVKPSAVDLTQYDPAEIGSVEGT